LVWNAKTGEPIANGESLPADFAQRVYHPSFSPDGHSLVYFSGEPAPKGSWARNAKDSSLWMMDFDPTAKPMLRNPRRLVGPGSHPSTTFGTATNSANMAYPTVSPDGKWVIFQRANMLSTTPGAENAELDNRSVFGDLSIVSTDAKGGTSDTPLDRLNGKGYPFAAGAERDMHYNYEPTLAPVAAGGYFWVVFSSRRTFGTELTGAPNPDTKTKYEGIKQLWVAAIDPNVEPGKDPSHPPFRLEGQSLTPNVRGFWALDPCKNDGSSCENGTECCGGYCDKGATAPVCRSSLPTCSANGDRCQQTTDCCGASAGVQCINEVCSEPMPK
jgi:hypothetical protein